MQVVTGEPTDHAITKPGYRAVRPVDWLRTLQAKANHAQARTISAASAGSSTIGGAILVDVLHLCLRYHESMQNKSSPRGGEETESAFGRTAASATDRLVSVSDLVFRWICAHPLWTAAGIGIADILLQLNFLQWPLGAVLDEPAHLATAVLLLAVLARRPLRAAMMCGVVLGSVLIDADHIPIALAFRPLVAATGRPYTHGLLTVVVVLVLSRCFRGDWRALVAGISLGIALHLVRDMATGGVPLLWPLYWHSMEWPYPVYGALILAVAWMLQTGRAGVRVMDGDRDAALPHWRGNRGEPPESTVGVEDGAHSA
jgi:inner membrane protein